MCAVRPSQSIWILKPPASSCGRGISLISKAAGSTLPNPEKSLIAQKYVKHPFLIDDYKFDLRIYALVTSFDPLKIYLFQNGLVR
jgi:tubulin polyglutamylase TTLL4